MSFCRSASNKDSYHLVTLTKAFGFLRNLRVLRCYGSYSSSERFQDILQAIPPSIEHILYSTCIVFLIHLSHLTYMISHISLDITGSLPNLEYLEYRNVMYFLEDGTSNIAFFSPAPNYTLKNLKFNSVIHTRLKALAIDTVWMTWVPIWVYNQLISLEINNDNPLSPINVDFICHHCPILEDFSATGEILASFCLSLPQETTFPRLQSLRLSCEGAAAGSGPEDTYFGALSYFIRAHRNLRRLYLRFPDASWSQVKSLLEDVHILPNLRVLGFHTGMKGLTEDELGYLVSFIPSSIKALHLSMFWSVTTGNHVSILVRPPQSCAVATLSTFSQMNALSAMPNLRFLHICSTYLLLPFSPDEISMDLQRLERVGLARDLWDIDRSGPVIQTHKWPRWKVKFFTESDFGDPDDAWLFKYP